MDSLLTDWGVPSFKIFMFYGGYGLHGQSDKQNEFLMIGKDERYDVAHFEFIMRSAYRMTLAHPELAEYISVLPPAGSAGQPDRIAGASSGSP